MAGCDLADLEIGGWTGKWEQAAHFEMRHFQRKLGGQREAKLNHPLLLPLSLQVTYRYCISLGRVMVRVDIGQVETSYTQEAVMAIPDNHFIEQAGSVN